jgi:hypothetical protein
MQRSAIVAFSLVFSLVALAACGASKLSQAPRASSLTACLATRDAAQSASTVVFTTAGEYPVTFTDMTAGSSPVLIAGKDTTVAAKTIRGKGWTLTMSRGGSTSPRFTCASSAPG